MCAAFYANQRFNKHRAGHVAYDDGREDKTWWDKKIWVHHCKGAEAAESSLNARDPDACWSGMARRPKGHGCGEGKPPL